MASIGFFDILQPLLEMKSAGPSDPKPVLP